MRLVKTGLTLALFGESYENVVIRFTTYYNGLLAVVLDTAEGERIMTVSVNPEAQPTPAKNQFYCKNWSGNEGIDVWLEDNSIAKRVPNTTATFGFCTADIFELAPEYTKE